MEFSAAREVLTRWVPLMMAGRGDEPVAATRMEGGTDVNFGELARRLLAWLDSDPLVQYSSLAKGDRTPIQTRRGENQPNAAGVGSQQPRRDGPDRNADVATAATSTPATSSSIGSASWSRCTATRSA